MPARPEPYRKRYYLDFAVIALLCGVVLLGGCLAVRADECTECQARAALALAKAKRERVAKATQSISADCYTDLATAKAKSAKEGKPLVLWIGMKCEDFPELKKGIDKGIETVHVHLAEHYGNKQPRVSVLIGAEEHFALKAQISADTVPKIIRLAEISKKRLSAREVPQRPFDQRPMYTPATTARTAPRASTSLSGSIRTERIRIDAGSAGRVGGIEGCTTSA